MTVINLLIMNGASETINLGAGQNLFHCLELTESRQEQKANIKIDAVELDNS
jgi:hypothetical protein